MGLYYGDVCLEPRLDHRQLHVRFSQYFYSTENNTVTLTLPVLTYTLHSARCYNFFNRNSALM
jgi:hypothetical protein